MYKISLILIFSFAAIVFVLLFFISAPYGKFLRKGWGPVIKTKWAWMLMEFPSPVLIVLFFISSGQQNITEIFFVIIWLSHYLHRAFIYPYMQSGREKPYPFLLVFMAFVFNCLNGFVNGYGLFHLYDYNNSWLSSWQFMTGISLFVTGFIINKTADEKLRRLRTLSPLVYKIPQGWLFKHVSSPHYFGEMVEWGGWAVMTWSLPGLAFFVFTFANLFPRAISSHRWYKAQFKDYPGERKAVIPYII